MCGLLDGIKIDRYFGLTSKKKQKLKNRYGKPVFFGMGREGRKAGDRGCGSFFTLWPTGAWGRGLRHGGGVGGEGVVAGGGGE